MFNLLVITTVSNDVGTAAVQTVIEFSNETKADKAARNIIEEDKQNFNKSTTVVKLY